MWLKLSVWKGTHMNNRWKLWLLLPISVIMWAFFIEALTSCHTTQTTKSLETRTHDLPQPKLVELTWDKYVELQGTLDTQSAEIARKNLELQSAENRKAAANIDTWKRFGHYSMIFTFLGMGLLILTILPWTKALFSGVGGISFIFIGAGVFFGALPHILENYGPTAFYPMAILAVVYLAIIAALDIRRRWKKATAEALVAVKVLDPKAPEEAVDLIKVKESHDPVFAGALSRVTAATMGTSSSGV